MKAMSTLSHPNLAAVYDWGEEEIGKRTTVYAVVEYLAGGSLRDLFDRGRLLDPSQALVVGLEACRGLDFAHHKGLVHTELTPSKLVFGDDRRLRIVDFGLARLLGAHDWSEPATVATHVARYASPEQALAQPVDGKTDVYSLALILVEAVTGTVPFAARSTVATLSARVGRLMPVSADLGPLASVLERAGRPEPDERSTAAELGRALVAGGREPAPPGADPDPRHRAVFDDDPSKLRRPNDPTGGVHRPEDAPAAGGRGAAAGEPSAATSREAAPADDRAARRSACGRADVDRSADARRRRRRSTGGDPPRRRRRRSRPMPSGRRRRPTLRRRRRRRPRRRARALVAVPANRSASRRRRRRRRDVGRAGGAGPPADRRRGPGRRRPPPRRRAPTRAATGRRRALADRGCVAAARAPALAGLGLPRLPAVPHADPRGARRSSG